MTRLTKDMKNQIVQAVIADLPPLVDNSEAVRKVIQAVAVERLPPLIQRAWKDSATRPWIKTGYLFTGETTVTFPTNEDGYHAGRSLREHLLIQAAIQAGYDARALRDKAESELRRGVDLCTTVEQFKRAFPDLVAYLPDTPKAAAANLPAQLSTMAALKAAGFPKEEEPCT